jgi:hypothetical protein
VKIVRRWEIIGAILIIIAGALLHFVYHWSGNFKPAGIIAAVNESTWEHLKIAFWPAFFFAIVEFFFIRNRSNNFLFAKSMGILAMPVTIILLFYGYTVFIEDELIWDIIVFMIAVIVGQIVSYYLLKSRRLPSWTGPLGIVVVLIMAVAFATLSYYAPHNLLFLDPVTGGYGFVD